MRTPLFYAIMFVLQAAIAVFLLYGLLRIRRARREHPDAPHDARANRLLWVYAIGFVCSLVAAARFLYNWMEGG
jgi:hypothetical protein